MSARPGDLCRLVKGKLLSAFPGFVDTFNWIVSFCDNLNGDYYISVNRKNSERPKIELNLEKLKEKISGGYALAFYGTDSSSPIVIGDGDQKAVKFKSASNSNVSVACASDGNGGVEITIGVYYK